jgi:hypothetical protein
VPERLLARANGMMWTTWSLAGLVSPALAAFILAWPVLGRQGLAPFGPFASITDATPLVIAIDTATFVVAAVALLFLDARAQRSRGERVGKAEPVGGYSRRRTLYLGPAAGALAARHIHGREPRRRSRRGARTPAREVQPGGRLAGAGLHL